MATISRIAETLQRILGPLADDLGSLTHFTRRISKLTPSAFVQALIFSVLENPAVTYPQLSQGALTAGVAISPQGLEQRFTPQAAELLHHLLQVVVAQKFASQPAAIPLLLRFAGLVIRDSSIIVLPEALQEKWPGVGGLQGESAAVKLQVRLDYLSGQLGGPVLQAGRGNDYQSPFQREALPIGAVREADLGFFDLQDFARDSHDQVYWITRYKSGTSVFTAAGQPLDLLCFLQAQTASQGERAIQWGVKTRLAARLLFQRVPQEVADKRRRKLKEQAVKKQTAVSPESWALADWSVVVTNIPAEQLSIREALVLLSVRWQIERLFRLWKGQFLVDEWRSHKPWRILCELYAKLIAVVIFHWTLLIDAWSRPDRSWWKAVETMRRYATGLALALGDREALELILSLLLAGYRQIGHLNSRRKRPNTYQRLLAAVHTP